MKIILLVALLLTSFPTLSKSIEAYFNHNSASSYTDPYYKRTRSGDNLELVLVKAIESANSSIDLAVYDFDLPLVAEALALKHKQGVRVRMIFDNDNSHPYTELSPADLGRLSEHDRSKYLDFFAFADVNQDRSLSPEELLKDGLNILKNTGISWMDDTADGSRGSSLMHHKFLVIDGQQVVTGSTNFTRSCVHGDFSKPLSKGNANSLLKIDSPQIAQLFTEEFEQMWVGRKFGLKKSFRGLRTVYVDGSPVRIQFSPTSPTRGYAASVNGFISQKLEAARVSVHLALFVFSEQRLANSLRLAFDNGAIPNALIDPSFATREYSELLDLWGLEFLSEKCVAELGNAPWGPALKNSGFTPLNDGDVLHHKFGVIDGRTVVIGSHNWSAAANDQNDEALLAFENNVGLAQDYEREFGILYRQSVIGPQDWLLRKIQERNAACGKPQYD